MSSSRIPVPPDASGRVHAPAGSDARIVSLVPSLTELLFALGLGGRVVGRTKFCVHPADGVDAVPTVGGTKSVSFEKLADVRPTHVIVNVDENRREDVERIERLGAVVVATHPLGPRDNPGLYRLLGSIFGADGEAERLVADFEAAWRDAAAAAAELPARRVLYLIWRRPWMTVSRATYVSRMLDLANWRTLPAKVAARYPEVADDDPAWREADLILLSSEPYPFGEEHIAEVRELGADRTGRDPAVRLVDGETTSWYGSRAIEAVRAMVDFARDVAADLPAPPETSPESPCIEICELSEDGSVCTGCGRTPDEIAAWPTLDDAGKRRVVEASRARRARMPT
jgi:ABC-type hemin transport system substrate-binding protein/predicted Fe-S protein YdhL (DUF1289 family)